MLLGGATLPPAETLIVEGVLLPPEEALSLLPDEDGPTASEEVPAFPHFFLAQDLLERGQ